MCCLFYKQSLRLTNFGFGIVFSKYIWIDILSVYIIQMTRDRHHIIYMNNIQYMKCHKFEACQAC